VTKHFIEQLEEGLILAHSYKGFMIGQLCCFWAVVKQSIMVVGHGGINLVTSWQPGSRENVSSSGLLLFYFPSGPPCHWRVQPTFRAGLSLAVTCCMSVVSGNTHRHTRSVLLSSEASLNSIRLTVKINYHIECINFIGFSDLFS
jgi:hypothetical protein